MLDEFNGINAHDKTRITLGNRSMRENEEQNAIISYHIIWFTDKKKNR